MWRNYLKLAFRNVLKYKTHSLINIIGLSFGIAGFVIIMTFVNYELSIDNFHENANQIYTVTTTLDFDDFHIKNQNSTTAPLAETLVNEFQSRGNYQIDFNGSEFISGIYFYRIKSGNFVETKKMVLMK